MATASALPLVSVDEYLSTSYDRDREFVDGLLVERGMPTIAHSLLQKALLLWFSRFEEQIHFEALPEVRTQITEGARYRILDVMLCPRPLPKGRICDVVPWCVIEIVSPDDTLNETRARFLDYSAIGVQYLVLLDPEEYVSYRWERGSLMQVRLQGIEVNRNIAGPVTIPFDSDTLFEQLKAKREEY